jgi:hypothetical protein
MFRSVKKSKYSKFFIVLLIVSWITAGLPIANLRTPISIKVASANTTGDTVPTASAAVTSNAGNNDGFETGTISNVQSDDGGYMVSLNTATSNAGTCTISNTVSDAHDFSTFGINIPTGSTINGITVIGDGKYDSNTGTNTFCIFLSHDGGTSWSTPLETADIGNTDAAFTLGGSSNTWGRTWSVNELSNANFKIRVMSVVANSARDAFIDYLAVNIDYTLPPPTIASAANQSFQIGQATTSISAITLTESSAGGNITAANDIRIGIATTTGFNFLWDTSDTSASISGGASGKVSTTVSYEGGGTVLVVPVSTDFSASDSIIISGLSFGSFNGVPFSGTGALKLYTGGTSDTTSDAADSATVSITGSASISNHALGQVSDNFQNSETSTTTDLLRFKITPVGEYASTTLKFNLSSITGITSSDITNPKVYVDYDGDGLISASSSITTLFAQATTLIGPVAFDATHNILYSAVGNTDALGSPDILRCDVLTGCDDSTDWTTSYLGPGDFNGVRKIEFDPLTGVLYAASAKITDNTHVYILRCDTTTLCDDSADWTISLNGTTLNSNIRGFHSVIIDQENRVLYGGGQRDGIIVRCNLSTDCNATADWTLVYDSAYNDLRGFNIDTINDVLYAFEAGDAGEGDILRCPLSSGCDASGDWTLAYDGTTTFTYSGIFDHTNKVLYSGQQGASAGDGNILRCEISTGCDATGDWTVGLSTSGTYAKPELFNVTTGTIYGYFDNGGTAAVNVCKTSSGCNESSDWLTISYGFPNYLDESTNKLYFRDGSNNFSRKFEGDAEILTATSSVISISDSIGSISFSGTTTLPIASLNYLLRGTVSNIAGGDNITITLATSSVISYGNSSLVKLTVSGSSLSVTHTTGSLVTGTLTLTSHANQLTNKFTSSSLSNAPLYGFKLVPAGENISITNLTLRLQDIRGIIAGNITNAGLYIDYGGDGIVDAGDTAVGGSGTVSINGNSGTIAFNSNFTASTTRNYLLRASVASIDSSDEMTINLSNTSITASGVTSSQSIRATGYVIPLLHKRIIASSGSGGGGTTPAGSEAPAGAGTVIGGTQSGTTGIGGEAGGTTTPGAGTQTGGGSGAGIEASVFGPFMRLLAMIWEAIAGLFD